MNAEMVRTICHALPASTEAIKWDANLVFSVGDKMFCVTSFDEHFKCSFKVADDAFEEMLCRQGFVPAPYLARAMWVLVSNDAKLSLKAWESFIKDSYGLVVEKMTRKQRNLLCI